MGERDYVAKEEVLKRLSEPEGDHELHSVLDGAKLSGRILEELKRAGGVAFAPEVLLDDVVDPDGPSDARIHEREPQGSDLGRHRVFLTE